MRVRLVSLVGVLLSFVWGGRHEACGQHSLGFGTGGWVEVETQSWPAFQNALGVACWMRVPDSLDDPVHLISRWDAQKNAEDPGQFHLSLTSSTRLSFGIRSSDGQAKSVSGRLPRSDGRWHHVAASWDGATLELFVDGKCIGREEVSDVVGLASTARPLLIGPVSTKRLRRIPTFDGVLSDVGIWSRPLSVDEFLEEDHPRSSEALVAQLSLRAEGPTSRVDEERGAVTQLTPSLARGGWSLLPSRFESSDAATVALRAYDLQAPCAGSPVAAAPGGRDRAFLVGASKAGRVGVLWQQASTGAVHITWVDPTSGTHRTLPLEHRPAPDSSHRGVLACGTADEDGNLYWLMVQETASNRSASDPLEATMYRADAEGAVESTHRLDTAKSACNVWAFHRSERASVRVHGGRLGMILPRTMYKAPDGLNHQGAIAVTLDAKSLTNPRILGVTSSHSKGNVLSVNAKGEFLGVDLGDNYPRGVHLHKFTHARKVSRVVFTFKTEHGTQARNGSPVYEEISGGGKTFYKWSNDNGTYTELGGVAEMRKAYCVVFATDQSVEGKVLDNSRAFHGCDDPRNLAMMRVVKTFEKAPKGNEVSDSIMVKPPDTEPETSGFFTFTGQWSPQRVTGVHWLTQYQPGEAARAPQVLPLDDGGACVLWEKHANRSVTLQVLTLDRDGQVATGPQTLGDGLHLHREDGVVPLDGRVYLLAAAQSGGALRLYSMSDGS